MTRQDNSHKGNGKANGHAQESAALTLAASVDAGGTFAARAAEASSSAAGTNRSACAEAAAAEARGTRPRHDGVAPRPLDNADGALPAGNKPVTSKEKKPKKPSARPEIPPGEEPLPVDGRDFVEAVHERVDLIALEVSLLRCGDDKIVQRELAYLRELRYGKTAASGDEEPQIIFDLPRPNSGGTPSDEE